MSHLSHAEQDGLLYDQHWKDPGLEEQRLALAQHIEIAKELYHQEPPEVRKALMKEWGDVFEEAEAEWKSLTSAMLNSITEEEQMA